MSDSPDADPPEHLAERGPSTPRWSETIVKAGLAGVPVVGGVLATIVGDVSSRHRERVTELGGYAIAEAGGPEALLAGLQSDERVADMLVSASFAASETAVHEKRRAMGRVVGRAARDDARIDESQVLLRVLLDLDAPEFHVLGQIAATDGDQDAVREVTATAPAPVVAALVADGLVETATTFEGSQVVVALTPFGRELVEFVTRDLDEERGE